MRSWGAEVSRPIRIGALNIGGQRCWTIRRRENVGGQQLEKWTRHGVAFNYRYLQWGLLCNWPTLLPVLVLLCSSLCWCAAVLVLLCSSLCCSFYAIPHRAWERLGDNCREKSNKHFFTDKRVGDRKALPKILNQFDRKVSSWLKKKQKCCDDLVDLGWLGWLGWSWLTWLTWLIVVDLIGLG